MIFAEKGCMGCNACLYACLDANAWPGDAAAIRPVFRPGPQGGQWRISVCTQCAAPKCAAACPAGALTPLGRGVSWSADRCIHCRRCERACPQSALTITADRAVRCDLCQNSGGGPRCVDACPLGLLKNLVPKGV